MSDNGATMEFRYLLAKPSRGNYLNGPVPAGEVKVQVEFSRPLTAPELELFARCLTAAEEFARQVNRT